MSDSNDLKSKNIKKSSLCLVCGAVIPDDSPVCIICGTHRGKKPHQSEEKISKDQEILEKSEEISNSETPSQLHKSKRTIRLFAFLLVIIFVTGAFGATSFEYLSFQRLKSQYNTKNAVLYQQDGKNLKIKLSNMDKPTDILTDYKNYTDILVTKDSFDNRFVGYLNEQNYSQYGYEGKLFLLDLIKLGETDSKTPNEIQISTDNIFDFAFSPKSNTLAFITVDGDLYHCDYSRLSRLFSDSSVSNTLIDTGVKGLVGTDGNNILYYKGSGGPNTIKSNKENPEKSVPVDLYLSSTDRRRPDPVLIDTSIHDVMEVSKDYTKVLYSKMTEKKPHFKYNINLYDTQLERPLNTLLENVSHVVSQNMSSLEVVYLTESERILNYDKLFTDSMLEEDERSPADISEYDLDELDEADIIFMEEAVSSREIRDTLRSKIKLSLRTFKDENAISYTLHYKNFSKDMHTVISENIYNIGNIENYAKADLSSGYVFYIDGDMSKFLADDISEWDNDHVFEILQGKNFDIKGYIAEHLPEQLTLYSIKNDTHNSIYSESGEKVIWKYSFEPSTNEILFIAKPEYDSIAGTLYSGVVTNGTVDKIPYIDEQVTQYFGVIGPQKDRVIYQTASKDTPPEYILYSQTVEGIEELAAKVSEPDTVKIVDPATGIIMYYRDYENFPKQGDLYLYNDEEVLLSKDIHEYNYYDLGNMMFFQYSPDEEFKIIQFKDGEYSILDTNISTYYSFEAKAESLSANPT